MNAQIVYQSPYTKTDGYHISVKANDLFSAKTFMSNHTKEVFLCMDFLADRSFNPCHYVRAERNILADSTTQIDRIYSFKVNFDYEYNKTKLPPVMLYSKFLNIASIRYSMTLDECRDKFGLYTISQWLEMFHTKS